MRFREIANESASRNYAEKWVTTPAKSDNYNRSISLKRSIRLHQMHDVVTPNFYRVRNQGGIICSPMYEKKMYYDLDETVVTQTGRIGIYAISHIYHKPTNLGALPTAIDSLDAVEISSVCESFSREIDLAITRAHADVDVSKMNLLASAGELPETLAWINSLLQRGLKVVRAFRKKADVSATLRSLRLNYEDAADGYRKTALLKRYERYVKILAERKKAYKALYPSKSIVDDFSGLWLEFRYALRPLINDLKNAFEALTEQIEGERFTARGHEYVTGKSDNMISETYIGYSQDVVFQARVIEDESIKCRSGILYHIDTELISMYQILGLDQPIEALYELIPFSFILDWFFSIGDLINSFFKSSGLNILTSWYTLLVERSTTRKISSVQILPKNGYTWSSSQVEFGSSHMTAKWKFRVPNPAMPLLPRLDVKLNLAKTIDLGLIGRALLGGSIPAVAKRS